MKKTDCTYLIAFIAVIILLSHTGCTVIGFTAGAVKYKHRDLNPVKVKSFARNDKCKFCREVVLC